MTEPRLPKPLNWITKSPVGREQHARDRFGRRRTYCVSRRTPDNGRWYAWAAGPAGLIDLDCHASEDEAKRACQRHHDAINAVTTPQDAQGGSGRV